MVAPVAIARCNAMPTTTPTVTSAMPARTRLSMERAMLPSSEGGSAHAEYIRAATGRLAHRHRTRTGRCGSRHRQRHGRDEDAVHRARAAECRTLARSSRSDARRLAGAHPAHLTGTRAAGPGGGRTRARAV